MKRPALIIIGGINSRFTLELRNIFHRIPKLSKTSPVQIQKRPHNSITKLKYTSQLHAQKTLAFVDGQVQFDYVKKAISPKGLIFKFALLNSAFMEKALINARTRWHR